MLGVFFRGGESVSNQNEVSEFLAVETQELRVDNNIGSGRRLHRNPTAKAFHRAVPLTSQQRAAVAAFFAPVLLDNVLLLVLEGERIPNPDFYPLLRSLGFKNLPDQSGMAAITFCNVRDTWCDSR